MELLRQNSLLAISGTAVASPTQHLIPRAFIRQPSRRHLDLLNPQPDGWEDSDLSIGLARTYRWGGHSIWPLPLSVAQHSLTVMVLAERFAGRALTPAEKLRELLHDAEEALIGGFDPIAPLKPVLGPGFAAVSSRLLDVVFQRYGLTPWTDEMMKIHKRADNLAAASEAVHVAGWSVEEVFDLLNIGLKPLDHDPLVKLYRGTAWKPWQPKVAAQRYLDQLQQLINECRA